MPADLGKKVAHLARDFRAVQKFVEFIPYELEKRIVARLGLVKLEALHGIIGAYKNELKRTATGASKEIAELERLIARVKTDLDTGIRDARNAQAGHNLALTVKEIPEQWLFMGHSTFSILSQDIDEIEALIKAIDAAYAAASAPSALAPQIPAAWSNPKILGSPNSIRFAQVYAGPWTPDVVSMLPGGHPMQDAGLRVLGLRLMMRQLGFLLLPFLTASLQNEVWTRLLYELAMIDFFALEEAVYDGNPHGNTPSLIDEWGRQNHPGVATLLNGRALLNPARTQWRDQIRNQVCAHMDLEVGASMLDMANWPVALPDFDVTADQLCELIGQAARTDIRTRYMTVPVTTLKGALGLAGPRPPKWDET